MELTKKHLFGALAVVFTALFVSEQFGALSAAIGTGGSAVASVGGTFLSLPTRVSALEMRMVGVENKLDVLTIQVSHINDNLIDLGRKVEANMIAANARQDAANARQDAANIRQDALGARLDATLNVILNLVAERRPPVHANGD